MEAGNIGPWSLYGLASEALEHYFPDEYPDRETDEGDEPSVQREVELLTSMGFAYWSDVVKKYHLEIGYKPDKGVFNPIAVNSN